MRLGSLLILAPLLAAVYAQDTSISGVRQAFTDASIPNDLKMNFNPKFLLEVIFPQFAGAPILVHTGIQLPRNDTAITPRFALIDPTNLLNPAPAGPGPFVMASVDLDAPSPQNHSNTQVRHLLGGHFAPRKLGPVTTPLLTNSTAAISDWRQPTPTAGNHRYVFLAFRQSAGFDQQTLVNATTPIQRFDIGTFAQAVGLGDIIAGTFMMVANADNP